MYSHLFEQLLESMLCTLRWVLKESQLDLTFSLMERGVGNPWTALARGFMRRWCVFTGCVFTSSYSPAPWGSYSLGVGDRVMTGNRRIENEEDSGRQKCLSARYVAETSKASRRWVGMCPLPTSELGKTLRLRLLLHPLLQSSYQVSSWSRTLLKVRQSRYALI